jgi:hypothetical protein
MHITRHRRTRVSFHDVSEIDVDMAHPFNKPEITAGISYRATIKRIMATASHLIDAYAPLPLTVAGLEVDPANWRWVHCLTLPLNTLNTLQFS